VDAYAWMMIMFAFFVTVVAIVVIVLVHLNFKETMYHCMNRYDQSIHAHDDASTRIADHRRLDNQRIAEIVKWGAAMAKTAHELTQFVLADMNKDRPVQEQSPEETQVVDAQTNAGK
jgi:hypothetical protein